jgi:predicted permease
MVDILNLALPYFGLIFIGFACAEAKGLPEQGLAWMNFFLLYVSLPALLFGIMSKTPFEQLNNPPFPIATTLGTATAFVVAPSAGRLIGRLTLREVTLASLPTALNVFVIARQNDTWIEPASMAVLIGTFASVITLTSVMWLLQTDRLVFP